MINTTEDLFTLFHDCVFVENNLLERFPVLSKIIKSFELSPRLKNLFLGMQSYGKAAFDHLSEFVKTYPKSALMPEALYRLLECHKALGLLSLGHKTFALLSYNFPKSKWRELSKKLMLEIRK